MANEQNLIPGGHTFTQEEASKGGKESAKTRRLQGAIKKALEARASSAEFAEIFEQFGIDEENKDYAMAIACALVGKAAKGDLSAASFVRDSIGEKPKEEIDLNGGVVIVDDITNPIK
jgi:hypothetical protein